MRDESREWKKKACNTSFINYAIMKYDDDESTFFFNSKEYFLPFCKTRGNFEIIYSVFSQSIHNYFKI